MKTKILMLVVILITVFTACNKEEISVPIQPAEPAVTVQSLNVPFWQAKAQSIQLTSLTGVLALLSEQISENLDSLSTGKVAEVLSRLNTKSAKIEPNVYYFPLDSRETIVTGQYVIRFSVYFEIDQDNNTRIHEYTFSQKYYFKDGVLDTSSFEFNFEFGCPQNKHLYFNKSGSIYGIKLAFVGKDGKRFFYNKEDFNGTIDFAPIADGSWYSQGMIYDGDSRQSFTTGLIDLYNGSNILPIVIETYSPNVKYYVEFDKSLIKDATWIYIIGHDQNGNSVWSQLPAMYNAQLPDRISIGSQFPIDGIQICGMNDCTYYLIQGVVTASVDINTGEITYRL